MGRQENTRDEHGERLNVYVGNPKLVWPDVSRQAAVRVHLEDK